MGTRKNNAVREIMDKIYRKKPWNRGVTAVAAVIVFITTYLLILPAITMTKDIICGKEEHIHNDQCYETTYQRVLNCPYLQAAGGAIILHKHDENCYDAEGNLICPLQEIEEHVHNAACFGAEEQDLFGSTTVEAGFGGPDGFSSAEDGFAAGENTDFENADFERTDLFSSLAAAAPLCGKAELIPHTHTAECYDIYGNLICGKPEAYAHQHSEECFSFIPDQRILICGKEEHVHDDSCYDSKGRELPEDAGTAEDLFTGEIAADNAVIEDAGADDDFNAAIEDAGAGDDFNAVIEDAGAGDDFNAVIEDAGAGDDFNAVIEDAGAADDFTVVPEEMFGSEIKEGNAGIIPEENAENENSQSLAFFIGAGGEEAFEQAAAGEDLFSSGETDDQEPDFDSGSDGEASLPDEIKGETAAEAPDKTEDGNEFEESRGESSTAEEITEFTVAETTTEITTEAFILVLDEEREEQTEKESEDETVSGENKEQGKGDGAGDAINEEDKEDDEEDTTVEAATELPSEGTTEDTVGEQSTEAFTTESLATEFAAEDTSAGQAEEETTGEDFAEQAAEFTTEEAVAEQSTQATTEIVEQSTEITTEWITGEQTTETVTEHVASESMTEYTTEEITEWTTSESMAEHSTEETTEWMPSEPMTEYTTEGNTEWTTFEPMTEQTTEGMTEWTTFESATEMTTEWTTVETSTEQTTEWIETTEQAEQTTSVLEYIGKDYKVRVTYLPASGIPAGAKVEAEEIAYDSDEYADYLAQAKSALGLDENTELPKEYARFFDIQIMAVGEDGEWKEIEPTGPVRVEIIYDQPVNVEGADTAAANIVHFDQQQEETKVEVLATIDATSNGANSEETNHVADTGMTAAENSQSEDAARGEDNGDAEAAERIISSEVNFDDDTLTSGISEEEETGDTSDGEKTEDNTEDITQETVTFEADSFSVYGVIYTVDFSYSVNGKIYQFSLPGGGFVSLADLVEVLGIIEGANSGKTGDDNGFEIAENADENDFDSGAEESEVNSDADMVLTQGNVKVSDATRKFVTDVASVEFSSPGLVDVSKVENETTVGQIKENRGLECEYSAELTEEQIAEINAQTVVAGDWALISVQPFISTEYMTVTMKNGESFTIRVTDAQISTQYLSMNGSIYEVTVIYGEDAKIPEGASLQVTKFDKKTEEYQFVRKAVLGDDQTGFSEETENVITESEESKAAEESGIPENDEGTDVTPSDSIFREVVLEALDISILDESGKPIEPEAPVAVRIVMKKLPDDKDLFEETVAVQHLNRSSGEVQVEMVADTDNIGGICVSENTATADFMLNSFSQFAITYYQDNPRVVINVHYVDNNGTELNGTTNGITADMNQSITLSSYQNRMRQNGYTYLGTHYGTYSGQVITSLKGTTSSNGSLSNNSSYIVEFYNGNNVVARQEYESSLRQIDVYLVYAPSSGYYVQDTIGEDGCLTVKNQTGEIQTGIDQNLFVRWYRSSNSTSGFEEVTQSKILNGTYNIPVLGGPKVNVAIDEGADQYYKAVIYKVVDNEEVILDTTSVYHVPYYDDVRNGGFETPHNNGTTNESVHRWPSNWQAENGQNGVVWRTTGTAPDKSKRDIEIPQGANANGAGANNLGETLRNYCFAFMPEGNQCAELNCEAAGALYQDVLTIPGDQMYWALYHRARGEYDYWKTWTDKTQNRETDTMYVVAMSTELAEKYDVTTQAKVLQVLNHVNDPNSEFHDCEIVKITTTNQGDGKVEFLNSGYTMTVPSTYFGNLPEGRTSTAYDSGTSLNFKYGNTDWHYYTGNFSIPENQYLTRFFFVAGPTASRDTTMGNFLDDIKLSDSVPTPNHGQATAIIQKTVKGLDTLPENYATRIEATYKEKQFNGIIGDPVDKDNDYDLYKTQIDESGKAVSTASWTFPVNIPTGGSAAFTNGREVSPQTEGKTDEITGYEQITTWRISKRSSDGETETTVASGTGKEIPEDELAKLIITERDVACIEFINSYRKKQPVSVWKTDMDSNVITSGAEFELYKASDFDDSTNKPKDGAVKVVSGKTGENGILYLGELVQGEYRLVETKAPTGYVITNSVIRITVSAENVTAMQGIANLNVYTMKDEYWEQGQQDDTWQVQVWNNPGAELPNTGGSGTILNELFGIMLTGIAGVGLVMKQRRRAA
ncbi:MAG: LPXTG cell wall anchor domain-containing protein [Blautia sp.]|nr:LPXTG cell wall anchor domain-containing protein [Blautia sp.]